MIHYHGTPITPRSELRRLRGKSFCVSFANSGDIVWCHRNGQSVMLDNGAFSFWKKGQSSNSWGPYYNFAHYWLTYPTTWAVIPDVIDGSESDNDRLIAEWFHEIGSFKQSAPVWHLHESLSRLQTLTHLHDRVCFGSSGGYRVPNSPKWRERVYQAFDMLCNGTGHVPCWIHMLRGMQFSGTEFPFSSVDSTDVARNHKRPTNDIKDMASDWDELQCQPFWHRRNGK